ncbi:hypothetical protein COLO4_07207 [Corchorus olitorius]|uniref:Uncharacterized protein n=1 Tax=Corchorus olitorius TaxID=93759 RepID=A0A1R3KKG9_9ROSI|nr:hypothetical protein COLO4_07207 [Corchorus olitorius]
MAPSAQFLHPNLISTSDELKASSFQVCGESFFLESKGEKKQLSLNPLLVHESLPTTLGKLWFPRKGEPYLLIHFLR